MTFRPGTEIGRREVLHGRLWMDHPVTVVADDGDVLAVLLEPGSPFRFHDHPFGPHPWAAHPAWGDTTVLQLHREGAAYAVWKFFDGDGTFRHWYVNFEAPVVRREDAFDTVTGDEVMGVLHAAAEVSARLDRDERWWSPWDQWSPPNG